MDIEKLKSLMKRFETMINTADTELAEELIASDASFYTPASPEPLYGGSGYLSLVFLMRRSFSDVQWKLEDIAAEGNRAACSWICSGTHDGEDFFGHKAKGKKFSARIMNFYYFNEDYKIINDIAAEGMIGILQGIQ